MASINERGGLLFFDFRYQGIRCREYTKLEDTPANRKRMQKVLDRIEQAIADGSFDYATFFPGSAMAQRFGGSASPQATAASAKSPKPAATPAFSSFIEAWYR